MQYILLIYGDEQAGESTPPDELESSMQEWNDYTQWLRDQGWYVGGDALHPTPQATTVRVRGGETLTTDGPFAETKEQLGGYYVIETENLDDAIQAAARCPGAREGRMGGSIEIRPIVDFEAGPPS
ncbi:MAG TPA: YciI family protein [Actinomycetota bacterium]|jgi:hypothetical protein|nr:YciI family protein [Actinomycetota bacterium]